MFLMQWDRSGADGTVSVFLDPGGGGLRSQPHVGALGGTQGCRPMRKPLDASGSREGTGSRRAWVTLRFP